MEKTVENYTAADHGRTKLLVLTALFAALGYVGTAALQIPTPTNGYVNLGDAVVLLGAFLLGPVYGAIAGGVGPALADLLSGYMMWVPGTLVIKALMGLTAALLYRALGKKLGAMLAAGVAAETIMVVGYWLYTALMSLSEAGGLGVSLVAAAAGIPGNLVQAAFGIAVSALLLAALKKSSYVRREFPGL